MEKKPLSNLARLERNPDKLQTIYVYNGNYGKQTSSTFMVVHAKHVQRTAQLWKGKQTTQLYTYPHSLFLDII